MESRFSSARCWGTCSLAAMPSVPLMPGMLSCLQLVPVIPGWAEGTVKS